jgi:hypothetical protein
MSLIRRPVVGATAVLCVWVMLTSPVAAQGPFSEQVAEQLEQAGAMLGTQGYRYENQMAGWLVEDGEATAAWTLLAGSYAAVGACDSDCRNVDLEAVAGGASLAEDTETDDMPVLMFDVPADTEVSVRLWMPSCRTPRCYAGVRLYRLQGEGGASGSALADMSWEEQVTTQLDGFGVPDDVEQVEHRTGLIGGEGTDEFSVALESGKYTAVAVCDIDCSDVDLRVTGAADGLMGEDVLADDVPVVEFQVKSAGSYEFQVDMVSCRADDCGYGFRLYRMGR